MYIWYLLECKLNDFLCNLQENWTGSQIAQAYWDQFVERKSFNYMCHACHNGMREGCEGRKDTCSCT